MYAVLLCRRMSHKYVNSSSSAVGSHRKKSILFCVRIFVNININQYKIDKIIAVEIQIYTKQYRILCLPSTSLLTTY